MDIVLLQYTYILTVCMYWLYEVTAFSEKNSLPWRECSFRPPKIIRCFKAWQYSLSIILFFSIDYFRKKKSLDQPNNLTRLAGPLHCMLSLFYSTYYTVHTVHSFASFISAAAHCDTRLLFLIAFASPWSNLSPDFKRPTLVILPKRGREIVLDKSGFFQTSLLHAGILPLHSYSTN